MNRTILVTGTAGFIGFHTARRLLQEGCTVVGIDSLNDYYEVSMKEDRLKILNDFEQFTFYRIHIEDYEHLRQVFIRHTIDSVIHLAGQAGVRYSMEQPHAYVQANVVGFLNMLECCRAFHISHLAYASSSSVYGANAAIPLSPHQMADHPISFYAATKRSNEMMAHSYSHLYGIPTTGLRFFTVYGPWGRPDMAPALFTSAIIEGRPINVFNHGKMRRDFTYIDDIVEGICTVLHNPAKPNPSWDPHSPDLASSYAPYRIYNLGNRDPVELLRFIEILEREIGMEAEKIYMPLQPGDVLETCADMTDMENDFGFRAQVPIEIGLKRYVAWFREYYGV